jgi:hypothetical protein
MYFSERLEMDCFLYFLVHEEKPVFKIGISRDVNVRIDQISNPINRGASIVHRGNRESCKAAEKILHLMLSKYNIDGMTGDGFTEWFCKTVFSKAKDILSYVRSMIDIGFAEEIPELIREVVKREVRKTVTDSKRIGPKPNVDSLRWENLLDDLSELSNINGGIKFFRVRTRDLLVVPRDETGENFIKRIESRNRGLLKRWHFDEEEFDRSEWISILFHEDDILSVLNSSRNGSSRKTALNTINVIAPGLLYSGVKRDYVS